LNKNSLIGQRKEIKGDTIFNKIRNMILKDSTLNTIRTKKLQASELIGYFFISLIVIIGTFPDTDWSYSTGIDPPLSWLFNYLFENKPSLGKGIIFPHGPLAFFMYPLPDNILLSILVTSLLKMVLVFNICWLWIDEKKIIKWILIGIIAYGCSIIVTFNSLILLNILFLYCNYFNSKNKVFKYIAFFLTALALFIKAYIAIVSGLFFFSFVIYWFYKLKNGRQLLIDCFCLSGLMLTIWLAMYGTVAGFGKYIWGMIHLAQDNSSAAAYYPYNNWLILVLFFILFATVFIINRTGKSVFYLILIVLGLFATWKHGMAREDYSHVHGLFIYVASCLLVFILFQKDKMYLNIVLSVVTVFIFLINEKNAIGYHSPEYSIFRGDRFLDFVTNFSELKEEAENTSQKNIAVNELPKDVRNVISNSTVDIYPWDYSIIAVNQLNWRPRVVIQSYAAYTSWLDGQNADHFNSKQAPDYLIWELNKISTDVNGGDMNSIDDRYLLNDEPQTMLQLLKHYDYYYSDKKFHIVKKRNVPFSLTNRDIGHTESEWGEWINVPDVNKNLLRAKLHFSKTFFQLMKSFLYKDEQFWIYLQLKNGAIHKYRIVPKNAEDGLWITPYIYNTNTAYTVEKIMFKCSMQNKLTDGLAITWEEFKLGNSPDQVMNFFHIPQWTTDSTIVNSINNGEVKSIKNWSDLNGSQLSDTAFLGSRSQVLKPQSYSSTFTLPLDSIGFQNLKITTDCWIKSPGYTLANKISLVISIEDANGSIVWNSTSIDRQLIDENQWNNIYNFLEYNNNAAHRILKIYVYNTSEQDILIDDFRVMIMKGK
jgi:hypothetical protein